jgi:hypothetical protein
LAGFIPDHEKSLSQPVKLVKQKSVITIQTTDKLKLGLAVNILLPIVELLITGVFDNIMLAHGDPPTGIVPLPLSGVKPLIWAVEGLAPLCSSCFFS